MNDLDRLESELRRHGPEIWAALVEFLPRFVAIIRGKRRAEILAALDAAHDSIARSRAEADRIVAARINDSGEADG